MQTTDMMDENAMTESRGNDIYRVCDTTRVRRERAHETCIGHTGEFYKVYH